MTINVIWLAIAAGAGVLCGFMAAAIMSAAGKDSDWRDGYNTGRSEATEHVLIAEEKEHRMRKSRDIYAGECERLRMEQAYLRVMAGLEAEGVE